MQPPQIRFEPLENTITHQQAPPLVRN
jgi:hypothetical protein